MGRIFNVSADCKPDLHYMADISGCLLKIKEYVDRGDYFMISRARQYGKTTTLRALKKYLQEEYLVISLDFQKLGTDSFETESRFSAVFARFFLNTLRRDARDISGEMESVMEEMQNDMREAKEYFNLYELFLYLSRICGVSARPVVLLIDEVDSASNNQVFLDFLSQLRGYYIDRDEIQTFQSVVLAGVYDIKNLKAKIRPEDAHKINSPWNIAADFDFDMSLAQQGIAGMLRDYERDHHTGMDICGIAALLYDYTSGYPFLVSRLCKLIDEKIAGSRQFPDKKTAWTKEGFLAAVRMLLVEENTLFGSLDHKLTEYPHLKQMLQDLLLRGTGIEYMPGETGIQMALTFGLVVLKNDAVAVSNRIFETRLYNRFLAEKARQVEMRQIIPEEKNQFITDGELDMELVIRKFASHYTELFGNYQESFLEDNGRSIFLLYMKPVINGAGNYYIEARTRTNRRTDLIIDFHGRQYIVELKIWRGEEYHQRGEAQLSGYLDEYHQKVGYMVSFNFNKNKQTGVKRIIFGDKVLIEAVV